MKIKRMISVLFFFLLTLLTIVPFLLRDSSANPLGSTYLFLGRMQIDTPTDMVLLLTPSSNFDSSLDERILRIQFSGGAGDWCKVQTTLDVAGVDTSAVDIGDWSIDVVLPGLLTASCTQSAGGDYIQIEGIGNLVQGTSYGLQIDAALAIFQTAATAGQHIVTVQLVEGFVTEIVSFEINLLVNDQITVQASVSSADSINCSLSTNTVNLGVLYKGGAYTTGSMGLTTTSTTGFYWAVHGTGGGLSGNAGLYNSTGGGYLLSSQGINSIVNLLTGEGFGMLVETSEGWIPNQFVPTTSGVFGSVEKDFPGSRIFLLGTTPGSTVLTNIYFGARAGSTALEGSYQETLTYVCGAYIGQGDLRSCYIEQGTNVAGIHVDNANIFVTECPSLRSWTQTSVTPNIWRDNTTGLFWTGSLTTANWTGAATYCSSLDHGGRTDWRVPTRDELMQVVPPTHEYSYKGGHDMLGVAGLGFTTNDWFWSANERSDNTLNAWYVSLSGGYVANTTKTTIFNVRCVASD